MNHIFQRNQLEKTQKNLIDFMEFCPKSSVLKLAQEITKIELRLDKLREYDLEQLMTPVFCQFSTKSSKMNKENFDSKIDLLTKIVEREFLKT